MYTLADFGSYTVGGRVRVVNEGEPFTVNFTRNAAYEVDPRGSFAIEHGYVQFFVPQHRNDDPPVLLVHGGGMSGSCWETTPDGRPGWLHLLLDRGHEVHVLDNMERGRAGFAPGCWSGEPLLRSQEEAWELFRIGPREGFSDRRAFLGQLFPVRSFDDFARIFVPRWLTTSSLQTEVLCAVLRRLGSATIICHSQGGELTFDACSRVSEHIHRIVALEPSAFPADVDLGVTICAGDFLDIAPHWQRRDEGWRACAEERSNVNYLGSETFGAGNSHMLMMDRNNGEILEEIL